MDSKTNQRFAGRESGIELARIVAMLMITVGHFVLTFGLFCSPKDTFISAADIHSIGEFLPRIILYSLCVGGVNLFILISGYFQIRLTWKGLLRFVALCIFYNALVLLADWLVNDAFSVRRLAKVFLVSKTVNWFFPVYFCLMLVSPLLNKAVNALDLKNLRRAVVILFILNCVSGYFLHNENVSGYNAYQFFFLYILGSWIRKDTAVRSLKTWRYLALFVLASLLVSALAIGILHFTDWSLRSLFYYNNPLIVIASAALFIVFTKLDFKSHGVNLLASTVVATLFTQHIFFLTASPFIHTHSAWLVLLYIPALFAAAFILEYPRSYLTDRLIGRFNKEGKLSQIIIN